MLLEISGQESAMRSPLSAHACSCCLSVRGRVGHWVPARTWPAIVCSSKLGVHFKCKFSLRAHASGCCLRVRGRVGCGLPARAQSAIVYCSKGVLSNPSYCQILGTQSWAGLHTKANKRTSVRVHTIKQMAQSNNWHNQTDGTIKRMEQSNRWHNRTIGSKWLLAILKHGERLTFPD